MKGPHLFDELSKASSLDLFRLYVFIERLLLDPKRIDAVRQHLSLGQIIRFFDADRCAMQSGRIVAMSERQVKVQAPSVLGVRKLNKRARVTPGLVQLRLVGLRSRAHGPEAARPRLPRGV